MELLIVLIVLGIPFALVAFIVLAAIKPDVRERVTGTFGSISRSLPGRLMLMALTGGLLLIPLMMVDDLRRERGYRLTEVQSELAQQWGAPQTVVGPMVWVPVLDHWEERVEKTDKDGNVKVHYRPKVSQREFLILPQDLQIAGDVSPQALHRGLYDVLVYNAAVQIDATFVQPDLPARPGHNLEILWHEAQLLVELSDLSAVASVDSLDWQGTALKPESGTFPRQMHHSGIRGVLPGFDGDSASVRVELDLRGMGTLLVGALGETTAVELKGTWDAPSFTGFTLPRDRSITGDSFVGTWSVPGVARPVPQVIEVQAESTPWDLVRGHTVGVQLVEPASPYASVERAITYGILVIALCLLTFLIVEHGLGLKLHPVQWGVNGLALVVFYLILLATSEHQGFTVAYGVASAVTIGLIAVYTLLATRALRAGAAVVGSLGVLYGCMYGMLRSEDYALLTGTGLVVLALACMMWVTRGIGRSTETFTPFVDPAPAK